MKRFRFKPDKVLGERLIAEARLAREKAEQLPPAEERGALLKEARRIETTAHIGDWANSRGLRSPE